MEEEKNNVTITITADTSEFEKTIGRCTGKLRELIDLLTEFDEAANRLSDENIKISYEVSGAKTPISS